ncbi:MAG: alkyl hydroperoxide reductase/Thiol specific antioxidant/Mal allergen [Flaviaesturariibacter sp.]|nr:alkyl hydroperoxide reductase/Thiol specific antioxidant/Mal allergen [Flaviaesturariibacter sp.]
MRFILFTFFIVLLWNSDAVSQSLKTESDSFHLTGILKGRDTGTMVLWYPQFGQFIRDTCVLKKGRFLFSGLITEPAFSWLKGSAADGNSTNIFIEKGKQHIILEENSFDEFHMSGSYTQRQDDTLRRVKKQIDLKYKKWRGEYAGLVDTLPKISDSIYKVAVMNRITHIADTLDKEYRHKALAFVKKRPQSYTSPTYLYGFLVNRKIDTEGAELLYQSFSPKIKTSYAGKLVRQELDKRRININAPEFTATDLSNSAVSLRGFKGKFVLLNFWASWCLPCIDKIPELKRLLDSCQSRGFEIINISIDTKKENWKAAVQKHTLGKFHNVLVNKELEDRYPNIKMPIPSEILINREGVIIWNSLNESARPLGEILMKQIGN